MQGAIWRHTLATVPPELHAIFRAAYPEYSGKRYRVTVSAEPQDLRSYWDGGSRDYFVLIRLADHEKLAIAAQSAFDKVIPGADAYHMKPGFAVVEHSIFCGKDMGLTLVLHPDDLRANMLPAAPPELSPAVRIVLYATASLKNSYGGESNLRYREAARETGITVEQWTQAKAEAITAGYLNKAGALTVGGRNALEQTGSRWTWPARLEPVCATPGCGLPVPAYSPACQYHTTGESEQSA